MTQLVFVHGVATRSHGQGYAQGVENRNRLLRDVLFQDKDLVIQSPIWGDIVPPIHDQVFETDEGVGSLSINAGTAGAGSLSGGGLSGGGLSGGGGTAAGAEDSSLAAVARANPAIALDALFAELLETHDRNGTVLSDEEVKAFAAATAAIANDDAAKKAQVHATDGAEALVGPAGSDEELAFELRRKGAAPASYSVGGTLLGAVKAVTDRVRNAASTVGFGLVRDSISPAVGLFLGDVFVYLRHGDLRSKIREAIALALLEAQAARKPGEKLVVIGHSMGGVILVDMLSSPTESGLPDDLRIDVLLTVGSQPGLFQSLGLIAPPRAGAKTPRPAAVGAWFNIFDPIDPLAFRADPIFDGVTDLQFDSITGLAAAHTTYFKRPQFYARCRKRLQDLGVI